MSNTVEFTVGLPESFYATGMSQTTTVTVRGLTLHLRVVAHVEPNTLVVQCKNECNLPISLKLDSLTLGAWDDEDYIEPVDMSTCNEWYPLDTIGEYSTLKSVGATRLTGTLSVENVRLITDDDASWGAVDDLIVVASKFKTLEDALAVLVRGADMVDWKAKYTDAAAAAENWRSKFGAMVDSCASKERAIQDLEMALASSRAETERVRTELAELIKEHASTKTDLDKSKGKLGLVVDLLVSMGIMSAPKPAAAAATVEAQAPVVAPASETVVAAPAPETTVAAPAPETTVAALAPETTVAAPAPETTVAAPAPETTVAAPAPETTVAAPAPETVAAPAPETVAAPTPETVAAPTPETVAAPAPETVAAPAPETVAAPAVVTETVAAPAPVTTETVSETASAEVRVVSFTANACQ
jgi:hypothetical protein